MCIRDRYIIVQVLYTNGRFRGAESHSSPLLEPSSELDAMEGKSVRLEVATDTQNG